MSRPGNYQLGPGVFARLRYRAFDAEGEALEDAPVETGLVIGYGALLPALERALEGKEPGAKVEVALAPKDAFGERDPSLEREVERGEFPPDIAPGDRFDAEQADGVPMALTVLAVSDESVVVDFNHPLAGQRVRVEVEVLDARPASDQELALAEEGLAGDPPEHPEGGLIAPRRLLRRGSRR